MALFSLRSEVHLQTPTVFIHGGPGANSGLFLGALLRHGSDFFQSQTILHDQPGCGFDTKVSTIYSFSNLCDHLDQDLRCFEKVHLLGESFGCTLALLFAREFPDRVASLTLVGPHFNRQQAQKTIYSRASKVALHLHNELISKDYLWLFHFLNKKKEKAKYRNSSSKRYPFGKDLFLKQWSVEKTLSFEADLLLALKTRVISKFLQEALLEVVENDLKVFTSNADSGIAQVSTDALKNLAKRYELFFASSQTFKEVKKCRESALGFSGSPYISETLDQSIKKYATDLENETDWESQNCWPWVNEALQQGLKVNLVTGVQDPFATGETFIESFMQYKGFTSHVINQVGHSPLYEKPEMTFKILESALYGR